MPLFVYKNPNPRTRAVRVVVASSPGADWEAMTEAEFAAWLAAQPPLPVPPRRTPVPTFVTNAQFRDALTLSGISPNLVLAAINGMTDPTGKQLALNRWEYANVIERKNPLVAALAPAFGLSVSQVDDLFRLAAAQP